jgi:ankyrin repeat protein
VLHLLLEKGVNAEAKCKSSGVTALLWTSRNEHKAVLWLLIEKGADIEAKDEAFGATATVLFSNPP